MVQRRRQRTATRRAGADGRPSGGSGALGARASNPSI
jgi:hypothetical protein